MGWVVECFAGLPDPRTGNATRHDLVEMVSIALVASICGAESCVDFADFARDRESLFREFLVLEHGLPSHDTFSRLFRLLDPAAFGDCFGRFLAQVGEAGRGVLAIDGKTLRRSFDRAAGASPLHVVTAFGCDARLVRKRGDEARLPARAVDMVGRPGAGSFGPTLWSTLMTTRRVAAIGDVPSDVEEAGAALPALSR